MFAVIQIQLFESRRWTVRAVRHGAQCVCLSVCVGTAATRAVKGEWEGQWRQNGLTSRKDGCHQRAADPGLAQPHI